MIHNYKESGRLADITRKATKDLIKKCRADTSERNKLLSNRCVFCSILYYRLE